MFHLSTCVPMTSIVESKCVGPRGGQVMGKLRPPYPVNKAYQLPPIECCFIAICICATACGTVVVASLGRPGENVAKVGSILPLAYQPLLSNLYSRKAPGKWKCPLHPGCTPKLVIASGAFIREFNCF